LPSDVVYDAVLFADRVITEANGKKGIIGTFDSFNFPQFPASAPPFFIFLLLRNLEQGEHELAINLVNDKNQVALAIPGEMRVKEPRGKVELILPVNGMTFYKPGTYELTVHVDGEYVAGKPLLVNEGSTGSQAQGDSHE